MEIRPVGAESLHAGGRKNTQTDMTKRKVAFRNCVNALHTSYLVLTFKAQWPLYEPGSLPSKRQYSLPSQCIDLHVLSVTFTLDKDCIRKQREPVGLCRISGFCRKVDEKCLLLGHYAASNANSLRTFRGNLSAPY